MQLVGLTPRCWDSGDGIIWRKFWSVCVGGEGLPCRPIPLSCLTHCCLATSLASTWNQLAFSLLTTLQSDYSIHARSKYPTTITLYHIQRPLVAFQQRFSNLPQYWHGSNLCRCTGAQWVLPASLSVWHGGRRGSKREGVGEAGGGGWRHS